MRVLLFTFLFVLSFVGYARQNQLPLRKDCIVKVISLAPEETLFRKGGLAALLGISRLSDIPLAGYRVATARIVYLQFSGMCDSRVDMSEKLFGTLFSDDSFEVEEVTVMPNAGTINLVGPSWRDGRGSWIPRAQPED